MSAGYVGIFAWHLPSGTIKFLKVSTWAVIITVNPLMSAAWGVYTQLDVSFQTTIYRRAAPQLGAVKYATDNILNQIPVNYDEGKHLWKLELLELSLIGKESESKYIKSIQSESEFKLTECTIKYKKEALFVNTEENCGANTGGSTEYIICLTKPSWRGNAYSLFSINNTSKQRHKGHQSALSITKTLRQVVCRVKDLQL